MVKCREECSSASVQFSSVAQSCLTLCDPMDCSRPGLPVYHQLLELAQTHVHWVGDATQPSHRLLLLPSIFPASRSFQMSQLFASGGQSIGVSASTSVRPVNIQDWFPLGFTESPLEKGMANHFSILALRTPWTVWTVWVLLQSSLIPSLSISAREFSYF